MTESDRLELCALFGVDVSPQGLMILDDETHLQEYIDRAEGNEPIVLAQDPYWYD